jgi:hypothetical protein
MDPVTLEYADRDTSRGPGVHTDGRRVTIDLRGERLFGVVLVFSSVAATMFVVAFLYSVSWPDRLRNVFMTVMAGLGLHGVAKRGPTPALIVADDAGVTGPLTNGELVPAAEVVGFGSRMWACAFLSYVDVSVVRTDTGKRKRLAIATVWTSQVADVLSELNGWLGERAASRPGIDCRQQAAGALRYDPAHAAEPEQP